MEKPTGLYLKNTTEKGRDEMRQNIIQEIKNNCDSSFYVFWTDALLQRIELIRQELGSDIGVCYAMKANSFLVESLADTADYFEVCSPGEYEICNLRGINPDKIIISGVNKTMASMERIISLCSCDGVAKGIFTIESIQHYEILSKIAISNNIHIKVILRLSSGNQFGMDYDTVYEVLERINDDDNIEFYGIHYYSGTQKKLSKIETELEMLDNFGRAIADKYGMKPQLLEYGPGLSVSYFKTDKEVSAQEQLQILKKALDKITSYDKINIEMGRFIAAECGFFVTNVVDVKNNFDINYCILDGGIHQLNYYGQLMGMKLPVIKAITHAQSPTVKYNLCGSLCTVSDVLVKEVELPQLEAGDYLIFEKCGAYSVTEGMSLFLSRDLPEIYTYSEKTGIKLLRHTYDTYTLNTN